MIAEKNFLNSNIGENGLEYAHKLNVYAREMKLLSEECERNNHDNEYFAKKALEIQITLFGKPLVGIKQGKKQKNVVLCSVKKKKRKSHTRESRSLKMELLIKRITQRGRKYFQNRKNALFYFIIIVTVLSFF